MLNAISNSTAASYPAVQQSPKASFVSLPIEVREKVENHLPRWERQNLFKALTTVTHRGKPVDSPVLKLHLLQQRIAAKHHQSLTSSDKSLHTFALNQLKKLEEREQLDKVVEFPALFGLLSLVGEQKIYSYLREKIEQEPALKETLLNWVERSKTEDVQPMAANAMTVLVQSGFQFNGADLRGIRVPGADLSFGVFDSAQLQGADLSHTHLRASSLRQANLSGARMDEVQFGAWPTLQEEHVIRACAYSPDGKNCAIGLGNNKINVYDTSSWTKILTLEGHTEVLRSVAYSPSGDQIASASRDNTVRLWNAYSGDLEHILVTSTRTARRINHCYSVAYSPNGDQLVSSSYDKTVMVWNPRSGELIYNLLGHTDAVLSVAYSPRGNQIASGSEDKTVRLWDMTSDKPTLVFTLHGHTNDVLSVAYSPRGTQIASSSDDKTVRLWNATSGELLHILQGHDDRVTSVAYSPTEKQLASSSWDATVRLWDTASGELRRTLTDNTRRGLNSVVYSPSGEQIAFGGFEQTVRLWEVEENQAGDQGKQVSTLKHEALDVTDTLIDDVQGLSKMNETLLRQRGAHQGGGLSALA